MMIYSNANINNTNTWNNSEPNSEHNIMQQNDEHDIRIDCVADVERFTRTWKKWLQSQRPHRAYILEVVDTAGGMANKSKYKRCLVEVEPKNCS